MVKRYRFGSPIETEAVLHKPDITERECEWLKKSEDGFFCRLPQETIVYGLGESIRGINKRGWLYRSFCSDEPEHREDKQSLYGAHNFLLLSGDVYRKEDTEDALPEQKNIGFFFDTPGEIVFDIGYTKRDRMEITFSDFDLELYVMEGESPDEVVSAFRELIGRSYIPPKWAFGYGQSRWSYETADDVRKVAEEHKRLKLPLDSVYLDIAYMERYKDFTIDEKNFGDFDSLVKEMKENRIHLVPIIDAGVKIEEGYDVYEEGKEKGYFCKDENGEDFTVGVWPGKCHFPDMLNEEARHWFGDKYHLLTDRGIDGFWNDMNEPAIFYSEKHLKKVFDRIDELKKENLDVDTYFEMTGLVAGSSNNLEDHKSFYHQYSEMPGEDRIRHDKVHNLYGYYMTRAAAEAFEELVPEKRILLFSRASYIGMHRYGGIWQGDNMSWWSHLLLNIKMMPSLNMCGFLYTGADLGGFGADVTEDLLIRFLSFGIFTPLMRNHSALGTRRQELYLFEKKEEILGVLKMRYRLLPYLYSEFMKAALRGTMMFRPLGFVYREDRIARQTEDQLLLGEELMLAPVHEQNQGGRPVYLPERMKFLRFRKGELLEEEVLERGYTFVEMPLGDICIFLREGHKLPLAESASHRNFENTEDVDYDNLVFCEFGDEIPDYEYYSDDGETKEYSLEKNIRML
ncbi:MAG: alpha-glucosidase [Lachnospiraceae bacterium]|nr:alpha-glucosidase [Lachnospiraceae bacterium]